MLNTSLILRYELVERSRTTMLQLLVSSSMHPFLTLLNYRIGLYILWTIPVLFVIFKLLVPSKRDLPIINGRRRFEVGQYQARRRFSRDGRGIILNGLRKVSWLVCNCFILG